MAQNLESCQRLSARVCDTLPGTNQKAKRLSEATDLTSAATSSAVDPLMDSFDAPFRFGGGGGGTFPRTCGFGGRGSKTCLLSRWSCTRGELISGLGGLVSPWKAEAG